MNSTLTYFLWIDDSSKDMTPDEEMEDYIRTFCPIPTDEEMDQMYREVYGDGTN